MGLSVSRVGRAAQHEAMKKVSGSMRLDVAQYREMAVFAQFGSDIDASTKQMLDRGERLVELTKQPQDNILSLAQQVAILIAYQKGIFTAVDTKEVSEYKSKLLEFLSDACARVMKLIDATGELSDGDRAELEHAMELLAHRRRRARMQNTNEIRAHIAAVQQTRKITNAMHLVSSSRLKKVMSHIEYNNAYFSRVQATMKDILQSSEAVTHEYLTGREGDRRTYVVVSGDKGMAGAYNSNVLNLAYNTIMERKERKETYLLTVGLVASEFFKSGAFSRILNPQARCRTLRFPTPESWLLIFLTFMTTT